MQKILSIQVLRAVAATMVAFSHVWLAVIRDNPDASLYGPLGLHAMGGMGVDIFFCISGFLMVLTLKKGLDHAPLAATFFRSRIKRIYPIYMFWLTVMLLGAIAGELLDFNFRKDIVASVQAYQVVANFLLAPALPGDGDYYTYFPQGWTLVYEMYFYVVFTLCLLVGGRRWIIPSLALSLGGLFLLVHFCLGQGERHNWVSLRYMVGDPLVLNLLFGAVLGAAFLRWPFSVSGQLGRGTALAAIASLLLLSLFVLDDLPRLWGHGVPALGILALVAAYRMRSGRVTQALVYLGEASYSIYLVHIFMTFVAAKLAGLSPLPADLDGVILSVIAVAMGCVSYSLVERPLVRRLSPPRPAPAPSVPKVVTTAAS